MYFLVNSTEMKQYDKNTIEHFGVSSPILMERAALAIADAVIKRFSAADGKILVVCGAGNNGGDGFAAARLLYQRGYEVEILLAMEQARMTNETALQYQIVQMYKIPIVTGISFESYAVVIDALLGIGLSRAVEGNLAGLIETLNQIHAFKIAADISSGISADSGAVLGTAFRADLTVTFGFAKVGQLLYPGAEYTGELLVSDIGIDSHSFLGKEPRGRYLKWDSLSPFLPRRTAYSHKGTYGKALIIAGSKQMSGAAYFAAKAAYYSGCGLVRILTAEANREILSVKLPEALITAYRNEDEALLALKEYEPWADAVLIGPGLSTDGTAQSLVKQLLSHTKKKIVIDADALNIVSGDMQLMKELKGECIVTPHIKEMSRLVKKSVQEISADLVYTALSFAKEYQVVCVLKDARTVIGMPDGGFTMNLTGNHGMATGGSGDVLAGFLTGFLAQNMPCSCAAAAVFLHGAAGDLAAEEKGAYGMTASDILEKLPFSFLAVSEHNKVGGVKG